MIYLHSNKSYGEHSDMSDGAEIGSGIKTFDGRVLHEDGEKARKDSFRRGSEVVEFFELW